ncbi:hypothetical protein D1007_19328 [Hordeum vulgare]|uniref:F-box domain-containing protein n=1 Tax=Hordeum vulgare subsp. vulgare TaxID=112509 RepID=A0A8I6WB56_HORVV|nr:hypothetical protein D1007_19328 [Hordeum vulgare]
MAGSERQRLSAWPDLPPDLLGTVLQRLPSLADRLRVRAVCRPWRLSATRLPPSHLHLPWLAFRDGTLLDVTNNAAHRVRIPDDAVPFNAGENAFFLVHDDGQCSLMDAFSGPTVTPLPELAALLRARDVNARDDQLRPITKVVVSSASSTELEYRLVAVMIGSSTIILSTCRPAGETNACLALEDYFKFCIADIRFYAGRIYAVSWFDETLRALNLNNGRLDELPSSPRFIEVISGAGSEFAMTEEPHLQKDPWPYGHIIEGRYLVECKSKLLMVRRWVRKPLLSISYYSMKQYHDGDGFDFERTRRFEVFMVDNSYRPWENHGQWKKVSALAGQALFVSLRSSEAGPAAAHGAQKNCIYFTHQIDPRGQGDPLGDSGVYSMRDGMIRRPLLPEPVAVAGSLVWSYRFPAWIFPREA